MEILKKNIVGVICGVLALAAIVALFVPLGGFYRKLQADLDLRKKDFVKAQGLLHSPRFLPVVEPNKSDTDREKLVDFPSPKAIAEGYRARDLVHLASGQLLEQAIALNRRDLLLPGILPNPGDKIFDFRTAYLDAIQNQLPNGLKAAIPPTPEEIQQQQQLLHDQKFEPRIIKVGGVEINREEIEREFKIASEQLPDQLRQERATQFRLYMDRNAISTNPIMLDSGKRAMATDLWFAQLALWIEFDVANAIVEVNNKGGTPSGVKKANILTDPIKRLVRLDIPQEPSVYVLPQPAAADARNQTAAPPPESDGATRNYTVSPTGRVCNSMYDVAHFQLVLDIDSRQIPLLLAELQRGKLLTVTQMDMVPVDNAVRFSDGYIFGKAPVVELTLQCEALFMREWTRELMPEEIKALLHVAPAPAALTH